MCPRFGRLLYIHSIEESSAILLKLHTTPKGLVLCLNDPRWDIRWSESNRDIETCY